MPDETPEQPTHWTPTALEYRVIRLEQDIRDIRIDEREHREWADKEHRSIWQRFNADRTLLISVLVAVLVDLLANWLPRLAARLGPLP